MDYAVWSTAGSERIPCGQGHRADASRNPMTTWCSSTVRGGGVAGRTMAETGRTAGGRADRPLAGIHRMPALARSLALKCRRRGCGITQARQHPPHLDRRRATAGCVLGTPKNGKGRAASPYPRFLIPSHRTRRWRAWATTTGCSARQPRREPVDEHVADACLATRPSELAGMEDEGVTIHSLRHSICELCDCSRRGCEDPTDAARPLLTQHHAEHIHGSLAGTIGRCGGRDWRAPRR